MVEEGSGGVELMFESDVLKKWKFDFIIVLYIVLELLVGIIVIKSGFFFVNILEFVIDLVGKGGYVVYLYLVEDMVVVVSIFVI